MENKAQLLNERISICREILSRPIQYFPLNQKDNFFAKYAMINILKDTHDFILESLWM